jgi:hypothetical protein
MKIVIETVPHSRQRYDTCGDYWMDDEGIWQVRISTLLNEKYESLVAIHELVEMVLCRGKVTVAEIDLFDTKFDGEGEPGDSIKAPYYKQHQIATGIERILAAELGVDWNKYEATIDKLE